MNFCPVCKEQLENSDECQHCKIDLCQIIDIKTEATNLHKKALVAFEKNRFHEMFFYARRASTLLNSAESAKLFACAAILVNKFDLGYVLWKNLQTPITE